MSLLVPTEKLLDFFMEMLSKKDEVRMKLLMERNTSNVNALTSIMQKLKGFPDGIKVYKEKILAPIKSSEEEDIPLWANLLHTTLINIRDEKDMHEIVKMIINKYENQMLQIKLMKYSDKNTEYKNVFDLMASRSLTGKRRLWEYFLTFIDTHVHNEVFLKSDKEGKSPLFRLISGRYSDIEAQLVLEKFEGKRASLFMTKDDTQKTLLEQSSAEMIAKSVCLVFLPKFP